MSDATPPPPTDDERRHAACMAMTSAPGLIRFATRYTRSLHDAEDAYQRAMEIALTRAPVVEPRRYMAWLHTVLRNEALAVARARRREGPAAEADVPDAYGDRLEDAVPIDALAEWRDRYRAIQDGLAGLTDAQRVCLMLQTAGASYERIREITGFSLRKVERSVLEGRQNLLAWEVRLASGEACARLDEMIGRVATGAASSRERRVVSRHVRHCGPCRATLRNRRDSDQSLAALVPVGLLAGQALVGAPDPSPMIAWWERVAGGATVRAGTMVQMAMEVPGTALAKVGAGTAAVAMAGAAGLPLVVDAAAPPSPPAAAATAEARTIDGSLISRETAGDGSQTSSSLARARRVAATAADADRRRTRARIAAADEAAARVSVTARTVPANAPAVARPAVVTAPPDPPPAPTPAPAPAPAAAPASVALEFGP